MKDYVNGDEIVYPAILDFSASYCSPCKMMEPVLKAIEQELPEINFYKIDVLAVTNYTDLVGMQVNAVPTIIYKTNEKTVILATGAMPKAMLLEKIKEAIK